MVNPEYQAWVHQMEGMGVVPPVAFPDWRQLPDDGHTNFWNLANEMAGAIGNDYSRPGVPISITQALPPYEPDPISDPYINPQLPIPNAPPGMVPSPVGNDYSTPGYTVDPSGGVHVDLPDAPSEPPSIDIPFTGITLPLPTGASPHDARGLAMQSQIQGLRGYSSRPSLGDPRLSSMPNIFRHTRMK